MTTPLTLVQQIQRFVTDSDLAHQFVHGGPTEFVQTEGGPVPTFANVIEENRRRLEETIHHMQGAVVRKFAFEEALIWEIHHEANTIDFVESLRDQLGQRIYANVRIIDANNFVVEFTEPQAGFVNVVFYIETGAGNVDP